MIGFRVRAHRCVPLQEVDSSSRPRSRSRSQPRSPCSSGLYEHLPTVRQHGDHEQRGRARKKKLRSSHKRRAQSASAAAPLVPLDQDPNGLLNLLLSDPGSPRQRALRRGKSPINAGAGEVTDILLALEQPTTEAYQFLRPQSLFALPPGKCAVGVAVVAKFPNRSSSSSTPKVIHSSRIVAQLTTLPMAALKHVFIIRTLDLLYEETPPDSMDETDLVWFR
ncbi:unnamed protein product [Cyprideis torosa]|uniref:Uncharacterized protein n=1 Tax=Cyprideis torosa TaxID=163714 RepID=A0A7R8W5Y4_9CRUS|nr:unnamed protein product [Cyprideis torosa]CAG0885898.1 unnamed protein product [Cyprideis torosa]